MELHMNIEKSKVLVVGGAGFVGSNLVKRILLETESTEIVIIDNLLSSDIASLPRNPRIEFIFGSVTEERILKQIPKDVNYVFHLACYHGNQSSIFDPLADHENNTYSSLRLFDYISKFRELERVVYSAAGCSVAEKTYSDARPTDEDAPVSMFQDSPYSISKLIGEMYGNYYLERYSMPFVKARFQNVYGPGEILGAGRWRGTGHTVWRNVIPTFIWKSLSQESLPLDNSGETTRDFIFVDDIVEGLILCSEKGEAGEAYNLASGIETSILELAKTINGVTGNGAPLKMKPKRDWDRSGKRLGSTEKSKRELNFEATTPLLEGLEKTVEWTKANSDFIQKNINNHSIFFEKQ